MKYKSRAIALTYNKHRESSIISKIFTEEKGLQVFIVKGIRSKKSKNKLVFFQPLQKLNINASLKQKIGLNYLTDISIVKKSNNKSFIFKKKFLEIFIAEICASVLQQNETNYDLFSFIWNITLRLEEINNVDDNFALKFLLNLSKYLGFYPSTENINHPFFNLETGVFTLNRTNLKICLNLEKSKYLKYLLLNKKILIPQKIKSELLKDLIGYFTLHHYNLSNIKSHLIIESLRV